VELFVSCSLLNGCRFYVAYANPLKRSEGYLLPSALADG